MRYLMAVLCLALSARIATADGVTLVGYKTIEIPITPFSNMASGYQATNPGFRAVIRSEGGDFIAGGKLTIDSVIRGYSDDASQGSAYGQLVLVMDMEEAFPSVSSGIMEGKYHGTLSICMARDPQAKIRETECKNLTGNIHPERPFQWLEKPIDFVVNDGNIQIVKYYGSTGDGGTSKQLSLVAFHPAYGFAAPGKAFKDYQSPLVLDLDHNGNLDLLNVYSHDHVVRFDLNGMGRKVRTGWVMPQDGLLFWDNGSGCVTNGTQLFGEYTDSKDGAQTYENGFKALAAKTSSKGKVVTAKHQNLKIWKDTSLDGICQKNEVVAASKLVKEISLSYTTTENPPLNEDNEVRMHGTYVDNNGKTQLVGDVYFKQRRNDLAQK